MGVLFSSQLLGCMLLCKQYFHFPSKDSKYNPQKTYCLHTVEGTFSIKVHCTVLHKPRVTVCVCIGYSGQKNEDGQIQGSLSNSDTVPSPGARAIRYYSALLQCQGYNIRSFSSF